MDLEPVEEEEEEEIEEEPEEVFVFVPPTKQVVEERQTNEFKIEEEQEEIKIKNLFAKITKIDSLGSVVVQFKKRDQSLPEDSGIG